MTKGPVGMSIIAALLTFANRMVPLALARSWRWRRLREDPFERPRITVFFPWRIGYCYSPRRWLSNTLSRCSGGAVVVVISLCSCLPMSVPALSLSQLITPPRPYLCSSFHPCRLSMCACVCDSRLPALSSPPVHNIRIDLDL